MLRAAVVGVATVLFADVSPPSDSGTTLYLGIASGVTAVLVAFIGLLGTRGRRETNRNQQREDDGSPPTPHTIAEAIMDDLRHDNIKLREALVVRDKEIDRLQRLCFMNRIDPKNGRALSRSGEDDVPTPG
jgi:hypothetical protein